MHDPLPSFINPGEALEFLDIQRDAELERMEEEARERMALDEADPSKQQYFARLDKRTLVKTEQEYVRCQLKQIPLKVIPYSTALQLLKEEDARKKQDKKSKQKRKTATRARKRNR